ncbi:MAG: SIMPL domain-containing protein [Verrucomicrobiota bacterium]
MNSTSAPSIFKMAPMNFRWLSVLVLLSVSIASAEEAERYIEVTGVARVEGDVDRIAWHFSVRSENESLETAAAELEKASDALVERLNSLELGAEGLRFNRVRSGRVYEREGNQQVFKGYFVERGASVTTDKLELSPQVEKALLADESISIRDLKLNSSQQEALKKEAVANAVLAAHEKAKLMVSQLGEALGPVRMIQEGSSARPVVITENRIAMPAFASQQRAEFEKISIESQVTVRFLIE